MKTGRRAIPVAHFHSTSPHSMNTALHSRPILSTRIKPVTALRAACALVGIAAPAFAQYTGEFSERHLTLANFDALVGLRTSKSYLNAVNLGAAPVALTINGVSSGARGGSPRRRRRMAEAGRCPAASSGRW
jgi:hypothetical protein